MKSLIISGPVKSQEEVLDELNKLLTFAQDAHEKGDDTGELEFLREALKLTRNRKQCTSIHEKIGTSYYLQGKYEEAKENLLLALDGYSDLPETEALEYTWIIYDYLGAISHDQGDYERALYYKLKAFEYIEHIKPRDAFLLLTSIGVNHEEVERYDNAIEFYLKALEISHIPDEDRSMALRFLGQCYDKKGDDRKAFKYYHKLLSRNPSYDDGGWYLSYRFAQLSYRFGNYGDSRNYFQKIIPLIPPNQHDYLQSSYQLLGYNYLAKNEFKLALNELKKALSVKANSSDRKAYIYCGIAQAYFGLNRIRKAIKFGLKALDEEFDKTIAERIYYVLAYSYSLQRNRQEAKYYSDKLREIKPDSGYLRELEFS